MYSILFTALLILKFQLYQTNAQKSNDLIIKFLFADKTILFNSNNNIDDENRSNTVSTTLSPNMLPDTFICYMIVRNNLNIQLSGNFTNEFKLNYESSTSVITGLYKRQSIYKLYSLKLAKQLTGDYKRHELNLNLNSLTNKTKGIYNLIVNVDTLKESGNLSARLISSFDKIAYNTEWIISCMFLVLILAIIVLLVIVFITVRRLKKNEIKFCRIKINRGEKKDHFLSFNFKQMWSRWIMSLKKCRNFSTKILHKKEYKQEIWPIFVNLEKPESKSEREKINKLNKPSRGKLSLFFKKKRLFNLKPLMVKKKMLILYNQLNTSNIIKITCANNLPNKKHNADCYSYQFQKQSGISEMAKTKNIENLILNNNIIRTNTESEKQQEIYAISTNQCKMRQTNSSTSSTTSDNKKLELLMSLKRFESIYYDEPTPIRINKFIERNITQASIV